MAIKTGEELAQKALDVAKNYKTSYIWGGLGIPLSEKTLADAIAQYPDHNMRHAANAKKYIGVGFGFDCVGLIKALLWGWHGNRNHFRGGTQYGINGVPDITADAMIKQCTDVSTDFSNVQVGEALWCSGHIGVYIGDGLGVECTPAWKNGVQVTAISNIGKKSGYNNRKWTKHGKLPYVSYTASAGTAKPTTPTTGAAQTQNPTTGVTAPQTTIKIDPAYRFDRIYGRSYTVTASALNMRTGAGTNKKIIKVLKNGEKVTCYGYFTVVNGVKWMCVKDSTGQVGYCSKEYLK